MRKKLIAVVGMAALLTGCTAATEPAPTVTVVQTVTAAPDPSAEPAAEPALEKDKPVAMGEVADFDTFTMTVHAFDSDPAPEPAPQPQRAEDKWAAADVEYCTELDSAVSDYWWRIVSADNRQYQPSSTGYEAFPTPAYAWGDVPVSANTCHRGWITFVVGKDADLKTVRYANDKGDAADWAIG